MIDYSIIKDEQTKHVAVRSTVKSFNLDHITDKDLSSFYVNISKYAHIDTGLLPLDGTGLLAYRQAANHAQIVVQHAPGISRILWGQHEGDSSAKTYMLAQPYRIIIGDILNGNFYGARIFYSINPITSPSQELLHVNLPNINCKGYRGNGVGWVCLYHRDDWTQIPLGEKVSRLIERCSGSEAYNDANMSETDGPRFYSQHNKPSYLSNPAEWEKKTSEEGYMWTLDQDVWIPILVKDRDSQGQHDPNGIPLTLGMALTGDYQAYYTDSIKTKPVNRIAREDRTYSSDDSFSLIKQAYIESPTLNDFNDQLNPYFHAQQLRENYSKTTSGFSQETDQENDQDELWFTCAECHDEHSESDEEYFTNSNDEKVCQSCFEEYYVYCEHHDTHMHSELATYIEEYDIYIPNDDLVSCANCSSGFFPKFNHDTPAYRSFMHPVKFSHDVCTNCLNEDSNLSKVNCVSCNEPIPADKTYWFQLNKKDSIHSIKHIDVVDNVSSIKESVYHFKCATMSGLFDLGVCPCGNVRPEFDSSQMDYTKALESGLYDAIDSHAYMKISEGSESEFNPIVLIAQHNNISLTNEEIISSCMRTHACKTCVCINQETNKVSFDPSVFDVNNFELLKQIHINIQSQDSTDSPF